MKQVLISFLVALTLASCDQDDQNGNLLVKLKSDGRTISQATIYLKKGTLSNPNIPVEEYDFVQRADGTGDAYFADLTPDQYFVYATGYDEELKKVVHGETSVTVITRTRQNRYSLTVIAAP